MQDDWGASREAWAHWSVTLGLAEHLLPVVSNPTAEISPDSKVAALGKVPSQYNFRRLVAGLPKWTQARSTLRDVARWEAEPDYGICLQTRAIRAIDIDVPNKRKAAKIRDTILAQLPLHWFPERMRSGTGKTLLAFRYDGELPKRSIPVDGGVIEFLGDGQQFIAEGMHPDGSRYEWRGGRPSEFPLLDAVELEELWDTLVMMFATGDPKIARQRRSPDEIDRSKWSGGGDEIADWLMENWPVNDQGREGQLYITCPFEADHTQETGGTSTAYFPANTGGYERGHFVCLHAHCTARGDSEFLEGVGWMAEQFPDLAAEEGEGREAKPTPAEKARRELDTGGAVYLPQKDDPRPLPKFFRDDKGRIEPTWVHLERALGSADFCGRWIAFDAFTFQIMWAPGEQQGAERQWRAWEDHDYVDLMLALERRNFKPFPLTTLRPAINHAARSRKIDTAQEWLARLEWDGVPRVEGFMARYMGAVDTPYTRAMSRYIWTALAGRVLEPGIKADMVPVFFGEQGSRKTTAVERLCPNEDAFVEINLMHRDEDTSRRLRGKLVAELGELRGLQSRDAEDVKSFITRRKESWIPKYMEMEATFWRRLLFFGSTNRDDFLSDSTGERRWLPVATATDGPIDTDAIEADREQLWAEGADAFVLGGIDWREAEELAKAEHFKFKRVDAWLPVIGRWLASGDPDFDRAAPCDRPYEWGVDDVLTQACGLNPNATQLGHQQRAGSVLRELGATRKRVWKQGWRYAIDPVLVETWRDRGK